MRRRISIFMFLLGVFAAVGLSAFADDANYGVMRLTPVGYRLGEIGDVTAYASSVVAVTPDGTSIVTSNKPVTLTAVLNRDYKAVRWQKFDVDPTIRTGADPIEEFGEKSETVSVGLSTNVMWMYVAVVLEYDPVRSVKASLSSFARGTVSVSPEKTSYRKGDVVTLTAEPAEGYSFVRWSDGNVDHVRNLTVDDDIDLTACIEPDSSRVSFSAGADAVLDVTSKRVSYDNAYGELPVPTRTGAKFSGWTDDEKRSVTEKTTVNRTADHTLYASWSDLLYEIAWAFTGRGNGKVEGVGTYAYGSQPTLKAVPYEGSDFAGWADGETRNPRRIAVVSNATYVAQFDIATYDVTFIYRDASGKAVTTGPTSVEHGGKVDPPSEDVVDSWPEHTFKNWSTEEYKKVTRDLAVEAIYDVQTYEVAFAYRNWQGNSVTTMPQHVTAGGKANPPDRSVVDNWAGNTFRGWAPDYNVIRQDTLCEAIYETNTYTVTFSYCDAKGEELKHIEYARHGEKVSFDYAEGVKNLWTGHVFKNWSCGGRVIADSDAVIATGNMQISAAYEGYARITYAANGGEGEMPMQVYTNYSGDVQLALNAFTRTGYLFIGWSTDGSNDPVYDDGDTLSVSDGTAIALAACWTPITYTLKFDGNGGTCKLTPKTLTYDYPRNIEYEGGKVSRDHYDFQFWSTDPKETNVVYRWNSSYEPVVSNLTTVADSTVVWYAIWKGTNVTVTINGKTEQLAYGSSYWPPDPVKPGYELSAWTNEFGVVQDFPITVTNSFSLFPDMRPITYSVQFLGTDGTYETEGEMEPQSFTYGVVQPLTPNGFTRTGYTFANWTNEVGTVFADGAQVKNLATNDGAVVDLYATWTMNPRYYAVAFDGNGGEGETYVQTIECGVKTALTPNRFARTGYGFAGWTNATGTAYADGEKVTDLAAEGETNDLYAVWTANRFWVKFEPNGADGGETMEEQAFTYDVAEALTSNAFTRTGYGFAGWADGEDAVATKYADGAVVSNLTAEADATNTLWATWTPNAYTVLIDGVPTEMDYGSYIAKPTDPAARDGYTFAGWTTNGAPVAAWPLKVPLGGLAITSAWTANTYMVRFNSGEGTGEMADQSFVYDVAQALEANRFTRDRYVFAGWTNATATGMSPPLLGDGEVVSNLTAEAGGVVTLTAMWTDAPSYAVAFDGNGADGGSMATNRFACGKGGKLPANGFTRTGYAFGQWTNETATGMSPPLLGNGATFSVDLAPTNGTATLKALWTPNRYWVAFDGNGADGGKAMENQAFTYDVAQALTSNAFEKTGHSFAGWATNLTATGMSPPQLGDGQVVSNLTAEANATNTLWAVWRVKSYEISFDSAGGSAVGPVTNDYGKAVSEPTPTKRGYRFDGWYEGEVKFDFSSMPARNVTLTAHWAANAYTVEFDPGEGSGTMGDQAFTYDVPQALTANGFTAPELMVFDCWTNETATGMSPPLLGDGEVVSNLTAEADGVVTLKATWKDAPSYAVAFDGNGGEGEMPELRIECGKGGTLPANGFTRTGYAFDQWTNRVNGATYTDSAPFVEDLAPTNGTATLSALWTPNAYWVKFDANGGVGEMDNQAFTYDVAQALTSNAFTKTGYSFDGWKTNETGSAVFADGEVVSNLTAEANATNSLWATWTPNTYTVVYHGPDGATSNQPFTYDQEQKLKGAGAFDPPEFWLVFAGWTNAVGKTYDADQTVSNLTAEANGTVNLYAVWADDSYTVTFDGNGEMGGGMEPQVFKHGETKTLEPNEFNRIGHTFEKWTGANGKAYVDKASFTAPATGIGETLHAEWKAIEYTDSFNGLTETFAYGETVTRDAPSSQPGYTFKGWTTNGIDVIDLDPATSTFVQPDHDVAFTSKWEAITYTIVFDGNGPTTGAMTPTNVKYDVAIALPSNTYAWAGHEFVKWTNSVGNTFNDGANVKNLSTTDGATVTLYAVWKETGDPLRMALGLGSEFDGGKVSVNGGAWTVIEPAKEAKGVIRTSESSDGQLRVAVPSAGRLSITFDKSGGINGLTYSDGTHSATKKTSGTYNITLDSACDVTFSGTPDSGYTWTLKNFTWTPAE